MSYELRHLHPLEAQGQRPNGPAPIRNLRARAEVALQAAAANLSAAHTSTAARGVGTNQMAGGCV